MTYQQIASMIAGLNLPYAYYQFTQDTAKAPPFICFYYPDDHDVQADNINYATVRTLVIELYTDNKDFALEATVETMLRNNELPFSRMELYIDSEKLYMITYTMEVSING